MDQLEAMDSNISVKDLIMMMQQGRMNGTIDKHNEKPDGKRQSIRRGESQQLYVTEKYRIRNTKKEQEMANMLYRLDS